MKMSGTGQKRIGERNYSTLTRGDVVVRRRDLLRRFLPPIFLRLHC